MWTVRRGDWPHVFSIYELGPGCKYDFMEEILKIADFFGLNLQSIFSYYEKNIFFENSTQKALKMRKNYIF